MRIKVIFSPKIAPGIAERVWHPSQSLRWLPGKRLELTLKVADTPEIRRWLLGFGAEAEVLEPPALREALRAEAEALARALAPASPLARLVALPESAQVIRRPARRARALSPRAERVRVG